MAAQGFNPSQLDGGIQGVTDASNAGAGNVGEQVISLVGVGSPVSLTTITAANVTSISLTAGDWDVYGNVNLSETSATVTKRSAGISATSATLPTDGSECYLSILSSVATELNSISMPGTRINVTTTTTIYLVVKLTFTAGTVGAFGSISARRVR
jgi:hypothetical protein